MEISFKSTKLARVCNERKRAVRKLGPRSAGLLQRRLEDLVAADTLADAMALPQGRCHQLKQDRLGQFAMDLEHPKRLIFRPSGDAVPRTSDDSIDLSRVEAIEIIEVTDYHG